MEIVRGQDLAHSIIQAIKYQHYDVLEMCFEVQFSCSRIYLSLSGIVDGLNMVKLFTSKQADPTTTTSTAGNDANLASISTSMLTVMTSKNAANHADSDKEETMDYNDMLTDIREHCAFKNHPDKIIGMGDLVDFNNKLIVDSANVQQNWPTVEYPELKNGNTNTHAGKTYVDMYDGTLYGHLDRQLNKNKSAFLSSAMDMIEWTPKAWFKYCMTFEKAGTINRVWLFPYYSLRQDLPNNWDFLCANQLLNADTDLFLK